MTTAMTVPGIDRDKLDLIKQTVARGVTDLELQLFLHHCDRMGLDPLMDQVYGIPRWDAKAQRNVMKIQVGIAGLRLIADRTKNYAPGPRAVFEVDSTGALVSAIATVKKRTDDGIWHLVEGEAFYEEYAQRTKTGEVTAMWQKGRTMLAKCAEALAIRKAFPAETSGIYTHEEMMQADNDRKPLRTGTEMLKAIEEKEAPGSVLEPPTEEVLREIKRTGMVSPQDGVEKASPAYGTQQVHDAVEEPPIGTDAQLHEFLEKFNLVEYIKAWAELKNDSLCYQWTPEQSKMLNDRSGLALKRLKDGEKKKR